MQRQVYNDGFKKAAVQRLLAPNSLGLSGTARQIGIPTTTLYNWKEKYANSASMKKTNDYRLAKDWTPEEKLEALNKTYAMSENDLGAYIRSKGLNSCELKAFRNDCLSGMAAKGRPRLAPEVVELRKDVRDLTKDLNNKDKALAEVSARIVLLKKSQLLWGGPEGEK